MSGSIQHLPGIREMLTRLISQPSISSASAEWDHSNEPVVRTLAEWLEPWGSRSRYWKCPDCPESTT